MSMMSEEKENANPTPAIGEVRSKPSGPLGTAAQLVQLRTQIEQLKTQNAKLTREAHLEREEHSGASKRTDALVKDNELLQARVTSMATEFKLVTHETATRSTLEKAAASRDPSKDQLARLSQLEKKLEQLQQVHDDGKKSHEKKLADQADAHLHIKRQLESQLQESKKQVSALQTDVRQMRTKVADSDRAESVRTKERQKRDDAESKLKEAHSTSESALSQFKKQAAELALELAKATARSDDLEQRLQVATSLASSRQELLYTVARQAGALCGSAVSRSKYEMQAGNAAALKLRVVRLERKLADRDAQNQELAHLIRSMQSERRTTLAALDASERALAWGRLLNQEHNDAQSAPAIDRSELEDERKEHAFHLEAAHERRRALKTVLSGITTDLRLSDERLAQTQLLCTNLLTNVDLQQVEIAGLKASLTSVSTQREVTQTECDNALGRIAELERRTRHAELEEAHWRSRVGEVDLRVNAAELKCAEAVKAEKAASRNLATAIQHGKLREELLEADADTLRKALEDAARYEQLFEELSHEMRGIVARGVLAEAEAERLSVFNAEILSHTNPQQKILYLDKLRKQLSDTQQQLIICERDKDEVEQTNVALRHELDMYKSVRAQGPKARSTMIRVGRLPSGVTSGLEDER
ncbi:hypothetical protein BKA62DRAFT_17108 [Auriculariales sp. MPI-PUGE-AT-0066]|nr:hypothetical protein BKA62DRAFT_17108 [Auriculariales sp. MPI-PUGE-AT-0066]